MAQSRIIIIFSVLFARLLCTAFARDAIQHTQSSISQNKFEKLKSVHSWTHSELSNFPLNSNTNNFISNTLPIFTGDRITLRAQDHTFLKRFYPFPAHGISGIVSYKKNVDHFSYFKVTVTGPSRITLQADNGKFLKRYCCFHGHSVIAAYLNYEDGFSHFTVEQVAEDKIRLRAENGGYLKTVYKNHLRMNIVQVHGGKDDLGIFKIALV